MLDGMLQSGAGYKAETRKRRRFEHKGFGFSLRRGLRSTAEGAGKQWTPEYTVGEL